MKCDDAETMIFNDAPGLRERAGFALHILFCKKCATLLKREEQAREFFRTDCIPAAPDISDGVMAKINALPEEQNAQEIPGGFSTRGWVIIGLIVVASLATSFFGKDFIDTAARQGPSFLVPIGIVMGIIISAYSALFIGSHLKELSERFRIRQ